MPARFLPDLVTVIGELLIGYSVIMVHRKMSQEHKIDKQVIREIKEEGHFVYIGMALIVSGFVLKIIWGIN